MSAEIQPRRALNCLQYNESNISKSVGLSNSQKTNQTMNPKQMLLETNEKLNKLKKRNSISLPDINLLLNFNNSDSLNKSTASAPSNKTTKKISSSKSNISIIYEDKENPNLMKAKLEKMKSMENKIGRKLAVNKALREAIKVQHTEAAVQCNKAGEDMVFGDSVKGTGYWRLIAYKRHNALIETQKENKMLHSCIENLNKKNEELRQNVKELYELIDQYKELQRAALEEAEENDEVDDSGFDL